MNSALIIRLRQDRRRRVRARAAALGVELLSTGGTAQAARRRRPAGDRGRRPHRLSRDARRPRQDAAPDDPRRPAGAPRRAGAHGGARRSTASRPIDLLVVNLYPFEATVAKAGCTLDDAIENIDIGGPAMVRAAAKNWQRRRRRRPTRRSTRGVLAELTPDGSVGEATRFALAAKAFDRTAHYDGAISDYLSRRWPTPTAPSARDVPGAG